MYVTYGLNEYGMFSLTAPGERLDPTIAEKAHVVAMDGKELDLFLKHVKNVPHTDHYLQCWYGDMAKFACRAFSNLPGVLVDHPKTHMEAMMEDIEKEAQIEKRMEILKKQGMPEKEAKVQATLQLFTEKGKTDATVI